jgi:hypothetical protein
MGRGVPTSNFRRLIVDNTLYRKRNFRIIRAGNRSKECSRVQRLGHIGWRVAAFLVVALAGPGTAQPLRCIAGVAGATYHGATDRYGHGVLGSRSEWDGMTVLLDLQLPCRAGSSAVAVAAGPEMVFEDADPVLADLTGDGEAEVVTVESDAAKGARLTVWTRRGGAMARLASSPFIGTRHRWMAQAGVADLDGDGQPEIAAVDRPHLDRVLRIWRLEGDRLVEIAAVPGVTNHRFGAPRIEGGVRRCAGRTELVLATADWSGLVAVGWEGTAPRVRRIGGATTPEAFAAAMACD